MRPSRSLTAWLLAGCLAAACTGCATVTQVSYQGYNGTAVVSTDGTTVTVGRYPASSGCEAIVPVARESATRVDLYLKDVRRACGGGPAAPNYMAGEPVLAGNIRLRQPLGDRRLVDGATGTAVPWISSGLVLRPADTSYQLTTIEPTGYVSTQEVAAGATQHYGRVNDPNGLAIVQSAGSIRIPPPGPEGWHPVPVRGRPGRATRNLITWRENGLTDYIQVLAADPHNPQILTTRQLIALADSATSYAPGPLPTCCPPHQLPEWIRRQLCEWFRLPAAFPERGLASSYEGNSVVLSCGMRNRGITY